MNTLEETSGVGRVGSNAGLGFRGRKIDIGIAFMLGNGHDRFRVAEFATEVDSQTVTSRTWIASEVLVDCCGTIFHNDMNPSVLIFVSFKYLNAIMMLVIATTARAQEFCVVTVFWRVKGWLHCIGSMRLINSHWISVNNFSC